MHVNGEQKTAVPTIAIYEFQMNFQHFDNTIQSFTRTHTHTHTRAHAHGGMCARIVVPSLILFIYLFN